MQVLIFELADQTVGENDLAKLEKHRFKVFQLPVKVFPSVSLSTDYRDTQYAQNMIGKVLPPVLIHGRKWIDGRHRIWALKQSKITIVKCIDLMEVFSNYAYEPLGLIESYYHK